eukprot:Amastigsp_a339796_277.p1 type:complete len:311 gc:universal Amastigsp_a339796_277:1054-122(-)
MEPAVPPSTEAPLSGLLCAASRLVLKVMPTSWRRSHEAEVLAAVSRLTDEELSKRKDIVSDTLVRQVSQGRSHSLYSCSTCSRTFTRASNLRRHQREQAHGSASERGHAREQATTSSSSRARSGHHSTQDISDDGSPPSGEAASIAVLQCEFCGVAFRRRGDLHRHLRAHLRGDAAPPPSAPAEQNINNKSAHSHATANGLASCALQCAAASLDCDHTQQDAVQVWHDDHFDVLIGDSLHHWHDGHCHDHGRFAGPLFPAGSVCFGAENALHKVQGSASATMSSSASSGVRSNRSGSGAEGTGGAPSDPS